jgi:citrate synthase
MSNGKVTKPVIAYIAGTVAELFEEPPQFGHAKAMASKHSETAKAKKEALRAAGARVLDVFADLTSELGGNEMKHEPQQHRPIKQRRKSLIVSRISGDVKGDVQLLGKDLLATVEENSLAGLDISLLLGHPVTSSKLIEFTDYILRLLTDHGPYVAGAVNTIVSARAGKDLASSLTTGLLTIGPRFGGAVNAAADAWLKGVRTEARPKDFVAGFTSNGGIIPGIGHKKYRIDNPDPRVKALVEQFAGNSNGDNYLNFARGVESVTTAKKGNLILNVDGTIAAIMLDILESELNYSQDQLQELVDIEFFNAVFILSRSVGFIAHYLDQRRHDEGLLRLGDDDIKYIP